MPAETNELGTFDRYLTVWIFAAMATGLALGKLFPEFGGATGSLSVGSVNIPLAIGLIAMMYPPLAKVRYGKMRSVFADKKLLGISLALNWVAGPLLMFALAMIFLGDQPAYFSGVVMIGAARCIAMVLVWNGLAGGENDYAAGLVAMNSVFQITLYGPMVWFLLSVLAPSLGMPSASVEISLAETAGSVLLYLGVPMAAGAATRAWCIKRRGADHFELSVAPALSKITPVALLTTIVVMFSMKSDMILQLPLNVVRIALPLVLYFGIMFFSAAAISRKAGASYEQMASISLTATGNNFELAIAISAASFGLSSGEAFAAVIGPLIEVPVLVLLVRASLYMRKALYIGSENQEIERNGQYGPRDA